MQALNGLILIQILLLQFQAFGQSNGSPINVLQIENKKYFKETNEFYSDKAFIVKQDVCYGDPNIFDDISCHQLTITFLDTLKAKSLRVLDIANDTTIIRCQYGEKKFSYFFDTTKTIFGQIRIVSWEMDKIQLELMIKVLYETSDFKGTIISKKTITYEGQRYFIKSRKS